MRLSKFHIPFQFRLCILFSMSQISLIMLCKYCSIIYDLFSLHAYIYTGDGSLLKRLEERRHAAEAREARLREASSFLDDDGIMEKIFNSLTGTKMNDHMYIPL